MGRKDVLKTHLRVRLGAAWDHRLGIEFEISEAARLLLGWGW